MPFTEHHQQIKNLEDCVKTADAKFKEVKIRPNRTEQYSRNVTENKYKFS